MSDTIHASVARVGDHGVVIRGRPGSGKSSLLLALLSFPDARATLVADDRARLAVAEGRLLASVPEAVAGQMEIRGVGIVRRPHVASVAVDLVVDLLPLAECPRLPDDEESRVLLAGISVPRIFVAIGAHDGVLRVLAALARSPVEILR